MADNMDLEKDVDLEEVVSEEETVGIATELLHEFKENNNRMDEHNKRLISSLKVSIISFSVTIVLIISIFLGVFLYFVHNFEFESYSQDGSGYNNINTGEQGDVINGAEVPENQEEER